MIWCALIVAKEVSDLDLHSLQFLKLEMRSVHLGEPKCQHWHSFTTSRHYITKELLESRAKNCWSSLTIQVHILCCLTEELLHLLSSFYWLLLMNHPEVVCVPWDFCEAHLNCPQVSNFSVPRYFYVTK